VAAIHTQLSPSEVVGMYFRIIGVHNISAPGTQLLHLLKNVLALLLRTIEVLGSNFSLEPVILSEVSRNILQFFRRMSL
jgi:hypothetical protein